MNDRSSDKNRRILIIDDNAAIHRDFQSILGGDAPSASLDATATALFGEAESLREDEAYEIDFADQGQEGLAKVIASLKADQPYAMAFVDMRMPPGWDGIETIQRLWKEDSQLQVVICTAHSDYSWFEIVEQLEGRRDQLLILKKPFDNAEIFQLAAALTEKYHLAKQARLKMNELKNMVERHTQSLHESNERLQMATVEREQAQSELAEARKLEAVGQLAAGIAHEINTPTQFVSDSAHFLNEAFDDQRKLIAKYRGAIDMIGRDGGHEELLAEIREAEVIADIEYLEEHVPAAFERSIDGLNRISTIVSAMKEFAHPDQREKSPADLNQALRATLTIAKNEYKYVADVETHLGELPPVHCYLGNLNQVFLNLLVNASHAIGDVVGDSGEKGVIRVRTVYDGDTVRIEIEDTGCGIPAAIRDRIFDPFFTTKEVGKGSGQGLAIARSVVVDKHNGSLTCQSEEGKGTTFIIRLPVGRKGE